MIAALAVLAASPTSYVLAQGQSQSPTSSSQSAQPAPAPAPVPANGQYVAINPLAGVRYDNRYDLSLGMAYQHMKAGPTLLEGANLGGLDLSGSYWLTKRWGLQGSTRAFMGTSGTGSNYIPGTGGTLKGPTVKEYFFVAGPEWLGPHNQHGAILAHLLVGGVYGDFEKNLLGVPAGWYDFYHNQVAPAAIIGGHFDLNRSAHWVFRITPDAVMTHYNFTNTFATPAQSYSQFDVNFAISVGMEYKFKKTR